ncbi:MAG: hypothetical protein ABIK45_01515 [Pseudomonadota bacterium]
MHINTHQLMPDGYAPETLTPDVMPTAADTPGPEDAPSRSVGDLAIFSPEAIQAFRESAIEPIKNGTFSLRQIESRIQTVRAEILEVWNSALPDDEKFRIISSRENEIALLQAGQFTFAKAGFSRTA